MSNQFNNTTTLELSDMNSIIDTQGINNIQKLGKINTDIRINKIEFKRTDVLSNLLQKLKLTQTPYKTLKDSIIIYKNSSSYSNSYGLSTIYADITVMSNLGIHIKRSNMDTSIFSDYRINEVDLSNTSIDHLRLAFISLEVKKIQLGNVKVQRANSLNNICHNCKHLESIDFGQLDFNEARDLSGMFSGCESLKHIDFKDKTAENIKYTSWMFKDCVNLEEIRMPNLKLQPEDKVDTVGKIDTRVYSMFRNNYSIKYIDLSSMDSSLYETKAFRDTNNKQECTIKFKDRTVTMLART